MACLPWLSTNSDFSLFAIHNTIGPIKFPKGIINLLKVDKWMNVAIFFWWLSNIILKHIVIAYTNICLKEGIMLRIVPKFNIKLTNGNVDFFQYFS